MVERVPRVSPLPETKETGKRTKQRRDSGKRDNGAREAKERQRRERDKGEIDIEERQGRMASEDSSCLPSCSSHLQLANNYFAANSFFLKGTKFASKSNTPSYAVNELQNFQPVIHS